MSASVTPLFFPEALNSPGRWTELGKTHGLTQKDFEWFSHVKLASHALRNQQKSPMLAERILVGTGELSLPLAGCFVLSATPDDKGEILYTPYAGIKKFKSRTALSTQIKNQLDSAEEDDDLLAFMSLSARRTLAEATDFTVKFETIDGNVFGDQSAVIKTNQRGNDQAMLDELKKLPSLTALLDTVLDELLQSDFPGVKQSEMQVNFYSEAATENIEGTTSTRRWIKSMSLGESVLLYYRHQQWPTGHYPEFSHSKKTPVKQDLQRWETAVKTASSSLISQLSKELQNYWDKASVDGATRREFFSRAILEKARAELLLKREAGVITPEQSRTLHSLFESSSALTLETVRLWEYQPNFVELAGSLMISKDSAHAFLYTPSRGLLVLKDYQYLKNTLVTKSISAGHDDELYGLMSLEERRLFIGFHQPQISGAAITGSVFKTLFESIISKQVQNMDYALQVLRQSDDAVDIHALFDKALDIRSMVGEQLLTLDADERWSTRPAWLDNFQSSMVLADTAAIYVKTLTSIESPINSEFAGQPINTKAAQRAYLENMKPRLAHALSVGVRAEAALRELDGTLRNADWHLVDNVFNPERADRKTRRVINRFRPDVFSLVLECSGQKNVLPLAHCVLLTERGGLDIQHSGRAILWTPAAGLEVFATVGIARQQLDLRLRDAEKRLELLENLSPDQYQFHRRYTLNRLQLIEGNVLQHVAQSAIDHFLGRCESIRSLDVSDTLQNKALKKLTQTPIDINLRRAASIAEAITRQHSLPGWLGMASVEEQQLHLELLQQYSHNVTDDKDYLHGVQTLADYVRQTLRSLLTSRFPGQTLDPDKIEISPQLALAGPAQSLTDFALNHVNIAQGTGFRVASKTADALPAGLNQAAVRQLLLSLNIRQDFGKKLTDALSGTDAAERTLRFTQQLPWQLLQHAHALKLQRHLSTNGFDLIRQVLDMPDATARHTVKGAHAIIRPLELIKTAGATAVKALGLYLIGPGTGQKGSHILFAPYRTGPVFAEFDTEAELVAAINTPGELQDLIIRRLPENQQVSFRSLFESNIGETSEITLGSTAIEGNVLIRFFNDNASLLAQMLGSQSKPSEQSDWHVVKQLFSSGTRQVSSLLPGKLSRIPFLWQSFKDFKDSAQALQDHHWKRAVRGFIAGAAQMISLGRLELEASPIPEQSACDTAPVDTTVVAQPWSQVKSTSPLRTLLQHFEVSSVQLKDLKKDSANGTYLDATGKHQYAPIAGKVYPVQKADKVWRVINDKQEGPALLATSDKQLVIDPGTRGIGYGKALSKVSKKHDEFVTSYQARQVLNIEARGMTEIRAKFPAKAAMLVSAIDLARFYAFNALHNLSQLRGLTPGTRLETFLKEFFDVSNVDANLLDKIKEAIVPVCNDLVDPDNDLLNDDRLVVGSNRNVNSDVIAFTDANDPLKRVHFSEHFFAPGLDWYEYSLTEPFDVITHSQASTITHEISHQSKKSVDIVYVESRRPFSDLVETLTEQGQEMKQEQIELQRNALSLDTPREKLFSRWNDNLNEWIDLDFTDIDHDAVDAILEITGRDTIDEARDDFLDENNAEPRINIILRNADSIARLISEMGRQLDPMPAANP
jgi:hypothetical protein